MQEKLENYIFVLKVRPYLVIVPLIVTSEEPKNLIGECLIFRARHEKRIDYRIKSPFYVSVYKQEWHLFHDREQMTNKCNRFQVEK